MDRHFLEFWGNFFIQAARGQQRMEDMNRWLDQGFRGVETLSALFKKAYGLDREQQDSPDVPHLWKKASEDFRNAFEDWMGLMGMVPEAEHRALVEAHEALKEKYAAQEKTLAQLQALLGEKSPLGHRELTAFQDLMQKQSSQFQELMAGIGKAFDLGDTDH
jgi:hypothetical protein